MITVVGRMSRSTGQSVSNRSCAGVVPYRFGHWAWVDPWGWTWVEDEPGALSVSLRTLGVHRNGVGLAAWPLCFRFPCIRRASGVVGGLVSLSLFGVGAVELAAWFPLGPDEPFFPWYHYSGDYLRVVNITTFAM